MRPTIVAASLAVFMATAQHAVAQTLTRDLAISVIRSALGPVSVPTAVEGISQASAQSTEAVVLASIDGGEMRLHFRRYDTGWRWETTETDNGSQVAARVTIAGLNEHKRKARIADWLKLNAPKYTDTAETFWWWTTSAPRLVKDELNDALMQERYKLTALRAVPISNRTPAEKARLLKKLDPVPIDAWGQRLLSAADPSKRTLLVSSVGPDGKPETADDLTCLFVGYKHFDEERSDVVWDYRPNCVMPEGLTELARKVGGLGEPIVKATQVVK
jgi:hypothetical protein